MNDNSDEDGSLCEYFQGFRGDFGNVFTDKQWEVLEEIMNGIFDNLIDKIDDLETAIIDLNSHIAELE